MNNNSSNKVNLEYPQNSSNNLIDMKTFINDLKKEDSRSVKKIRTAKWIYISLAVIYGLSVITHFYKETELFNSIASACYFAAFTFMLFAIKYIQKLYFQVDYSEPLYLMLKKTVQRHSITFKRFLFLLPAFILIDIGYSFSYFNEFSGYSPLQKIFFLQMVFILTISISILFVLKIWRKKRKAIRDHASQMIKELEE